MGDAANPERNPSWHSYRWRLEPVFLAPMIPLVVVGAAILYVMMTGLLGGGREGASMLLSVLLIAAMSVLIFLVATRKPSRKRSS